MEASKQETVEEKQTEEEETLQTASPSNTVDTDWNIDDYKKESECDKHWALRRSFMEMHKDKYPEDRLVCLAQACVNIEFLNCRYPADFMEIMKELTQDIAKELRGNSSSTLVRPAAKRRRT